MMSRSINLVLSTATRRGISSCIINNSSRAIFAGALTASRKTVQVSTYRFYSTPNDTPPKDEEFDFIRNSSTMNKVQENPRVLGVMVQIGELLQSKGYVKDNQPPGMLTVMKMLRDDELKAKLFECKSFLPSIISD